MSKDMEWSFDQDSDDDGYAFFTVWDGNGERLTAPDISDSAARLIATAPALLAFVRRWLSTRPGPDYKGYIDDKQLAAEAKELLAKATAD